MSRISFTFCTEASV